MSPEGIKGEGVPTGISIGKIMVPSIRRKKLGLLVVFVFVELEGEFMAT